MRIAVIRAASVVLLALAAAFASARYLTAADVYISEFLAINVTDATDEDGDHSDWIELYNPGAAAVDLGGWCLTDDPANLSKWRFPSVSLGPGSFLVVFASGKDRRAPRLHTNFRLSGLGEYLALVRPDGTSIEHEYAPYPAQVEDYSYGLAMNGSAVPLVGPGAPARAMVPSDGSLGTAWREASFDDASWPAGTTGVGYDRNPDYLGLIHLDVRAAMDGISTTAYIRIPFQTGDASSVSNLLLRMKYDDGFIAYVNGTEIARRNAPSTPSWDSRATALHDDAAAVQFEEMEFGAAQGVLHPGTNVLAIHGLNDNTGSSDFLILPELEGFSTGSLDPSTVQYFPRPTAGRGNLAGYDGVATRPQISPKGGMLSGSVQVSMTTASSGTTIRFTTDGSDPTEASPAYTAPFSVTATTLLRARGFEPGLAPSPIVSEGYIALASDVRSFSSDIPVIVVENFGGGGVPADPYQTAFMAIFEPGAGRSMLTNPPDLETRIGIKTRGSSTAGDPKHSYALESWSEKDTDKDVAPLGMPADSDWILYAPYSFDLALMRNPFIYELSREVGRYAVRCRFVELFVNTSGGNLSQAGYAGVYVFMEKVKRGKERVDVEKLTADMTAEPEISGGYMAKIDRLDPGDSGFSAGGMTLGHVYPKEEDIAAEQKAWFAGYINQFYSALQGAGFADPTTGYARYIDSMAWIDHHILNVLAKNVDALRLSTYMFKRRGGRLEMGPIWDFDRSMDSTDGRDDDPRTWNGTGDATDFFNYPWWNRLFQDPEFYQAYRDRWHELRRGPLSTANMSAVIDAMASEITEAQARNFQKWNLVGVGGWQSAVSHLKSWLATRAAWIDSQFLAPPILSPEGGPVTPPLEVTITGSPGTLYFTTDGTDPRLRGGAVSTGASVYSAPVSIATNARVVSRIRTAAGAWSSPAAATFVVSLPLLVVTEIHYHPADPPTESVRDADDFEFVELMNAGGQPLNLAGFRVSGGIDFTFPAGTLGPDEYVVVVKSLESFQERYGLDNGIFIAGEYGGNLSNSGDTIIVEGPLLEPILHFEYSDVWYPLSDGLGYSLIVRDPHGPLSAWNNPLAWTSGDVLGGTPGAGEGPSPQGGRQLPGDANQDGLLDVSDGLSLLLRLFGGLASAPPCDGGSLEDGGNLPLLDSNGDGSVDLSDAVWSLNYLFAGGPQPVLGTRCVRIEGCPDLCHS